MTRQGGGRQEPGRQLGQEGHTGAEVLRAGPAGAESEGACCRAPSRERGGGWW